MDWNHDTALAGAIASGLATGAAWENKSSLASEIPLFKPPLIEALMALSKTSLSTLTRTRWSVVTFGNLIPTLAKGLGPASATHLAISASEFAPDAPLLSRIRN